MLQSDGLDHPSGDRCNHQQPAKQDERSLGPLKFFFFVVFHVRSLADLVAWPKQYYRAHDAIMWSDDLYSRLTGFA